MGKVINLISNEDYKNKIKDFRFGMRKLHIEDENGLISEHVFIVLENRKRHSMTITAYSRYLLVELRNRRLKTVELHAKFIIMFLNYLFFDQYENFKVKSILDLKIEYGELFLRDYASGKIGGAEKTKSTVQATEGILNRFYRHLFYELKDKGFRNIKKKDFETNTYMAQRSKSRRISSGTKTKYKNLFKVVYPNKVPPLKVKSISVFAISELLRVCDIYYPRLKLAVCLQAFAGLRIGEVCNVKLENIHYASSGNELTHFAIDLREKRRMRDDDVNVGEIKRRRLQPIYPGFLPIITKVFNEHMQLFRPQEHKYGALFLNRDGEAMTSDSYGKIFINRLIMLLVERLSRMDDFRALSEMKILTTGKVSPHILRHFFTQYIARVATNPFEIALYRGDSSLDSAITYLSGSNLMDDRIKQIQKEMTLLREQI